MHRICLLVLLISAVSQGAPLRLDDQSRKASVFRSMRTWYGGS